MMQLSDDQQIAYDALIQSNENIFITGEAGSGKSFIIRKFMREKDSKTFPILASTGAAAVLVGGRTFHSFMGLGIMEGGVSATVRRALEDKRVRKRLQKAEGIVIDEISMLSGDTLRAAEEISRHARESLEPWGGLRIVAVGDFAQLPPVEIGRAQRSWAFKDSVWERTKFHPVVLRQNMRSGDGSFLKILNLIRRGQVTDEVREFLDEKMNAADYDFEGTRLFPLRKQTDEFNLSELAKLPGEEYRFSTSYSGNERAIEQLKKHSPLPEELVIKENALVMLRHNDPKQRWVNGSTGFVRQIEPQSLTIELLSGRTIQLEPVSFSLMNAEGLPLAAVTNFPISLAYAATIHKAQGMTLDRLMVNLQSLWEPGQAYVALSRVIDPHNLRVSGWHPQSIKADPLVEEFYNNL